MNEGLNERHNSRNINKKMNEFEYINIEEKLTNLRGWTI